MFKLKELAYLLDGDYTEYVDIASDANYSAWEVGLQPETAILKYGECNVLRIEPSDEYATLDIVLESVNNAIRV